MAENEIEPPIQHGVDMEEYDRILIEAGFEFVDFDEDDLAEIGLVFVAQSDDATAEPDG